MAFMIESYQTMLERKKKATRTTSCLFMHYKVEAGFVEKQESDKDLTIPQDKEKTEKSASI